MKRLVLLRDAETSLTSAQIIDLLEDAFGPCGCAIVPADEYQVVMLHRDDLTNARKAVQQEFSGDVERLESEICKLREVLDNLMSSR